MPGGMLRSGIGKVGDDQTQVSLAEGAIPPTRARLVVSHVEGGLPQSSNKPRIFAADVAACGMHGTHCRTVPFVVFCESLTVASKRGEAASVAEILKQDVQGYRLILQCDQCPDQLAFTLETLRDGAVEHCLHRALADGWRCGDAQAWLCGKCQARPSILLAPLIGSVSGKKWAAFLVGLLTLALGVPPFLRLSNQATCAAMAAGWWLPWFIALAVLLYRGVLVRDDYSLHDPLSSGAYSGPEADRDAGPNRGRAFLMELQLHAVLILLMAILPSLLFFLYKVPLSLLALAAGKGVSGGRPFPVALALAFGYATLYTLPVAFLLAVIYQPFRS